MKLDGHGGAFCTAAVSRNQQRVVLTKWAPASVPQQGRFIQAQPNVAEARMQGILKMLPCGNCLGPAPDGVATQVTPAPRDTVMARQPLAPVPFPLGIYAQGGVQISSLCPLRQWNAGKFYGIARRKHLIQLDKRVGELLVSLTIRTLAFF